MRARRGGDFEAFQSCGLQDAGDVGVEGKGLAVAVFGDAAGVAAGDGFQGGRAVRVAPEGPEGVVEVEDEDAGKG